ncbi:hypothetical protein N9F40_01405 [bacterium]|nr:hypothetical protein [bacterium]
MRTAYRVLGVAKYSSAATGEVLRSIRPNSQVLKYQQRIEQNLWSKRGAFVGGLIGVHIRMQGDLSKDIPGIYDLNKRDPRYATERMERVATVRSTCRFQNFANVLKERSKGLGEAIYFLSTDSEEAKVGMIEAFGDQVYLHELPDAETCSGELVRSRICVQVALAEIVLLSRTHKLYFSDASSFSEVAVEMGNLQHHSVSGCAHS